MRESIFSNLKKELVHHGGFETRDAARTAIFSYIELFYNRKRLHQTLAIELRWISNRIMTVGA